MQKLAPTVLLPKSALPYDWGRTLNHAKRVMGDPLPPGVEIQLEQIFRGLQRKLRRYGFAARNVLKRRASSLEYMLATSFGYRVLSVLHGYPKKGKTLTFDQVKKLADRVNPRIPSGEPVTVTELPKSDGGKRPIVLFGPVARANQSLARDLIAVGAGHSKYEDARKGRGRERHMDEIINANRNGGVRALGTFDIKDCFGHMRIEATQTVVPISKAMIRNTIYIPDATSIHMKTNLISENAVRSGLAQGALSSPIVAGRVIEPCLDKVQAKLRRSYLDDISLGDRTVEKVEAQLDALAEACLSQHPGSPLFEKCRNVFPIGQHADVLGYWPRPNPPEFGGGLRFSPSNKAIRRFYVKLGAHLLKLPQAEWAAVTEEKAYAFAASFKHWGGAKGGREVLILVFDILIAPLLHSAHQEVRAAIEAKMPEREVHALAASLASDLIPATVIADTHGLMNW